MLKLINNLKPFFEDCYKRINVREYAKLVKISPPTASKLLMSYHKSELLKREDFKNYIFFYANKEDKEFISLSRIYWSKRLKDFLEYLDNRLASPLIILFGSLSKAESKSDSDIDIAIIGSKRDIDIKCFEKKLKRSIQLFWFKSIKDIKNKELRKNIINGYVLKGKLMI